MLPLPTVKAITFQALRGLAWCHRSGLIHRDVTPHNLRYSPVTGAVKLAGFELAREVIPSPNPSPSPSPNPNSNPNPNPNSNSDPHPNPNPNPNPNQVGSVGGASACLTHEVVTLWYRAPEVLLGATHYEGSIDGWSMAAVLAELATGQPLLPGDSEIGQLVRTSRLLTPTPTPTPTPAPTPTPTLTLTVTRWWPRPADSMTCSTRSGEP